MIIQFIVCFLATISFAILFSAPKRQLLFCGLTGAMGWIVYLLVMENEGGIALANICASLTLTLMARIFAAIQRHPVTVYLLPGIFPLVPGAGIYYTSYYFIMHEMDNFVKYGAQTLIVAGSIVFGIVFGSAIPQSIFNALPHITRKKEHSA